jgi:enoyl-CoA hydratase
MGIVKEMAYTGRRLPAEQARVQGRVNARYYTPEAQLDAALACAEEIAAKPPIAIWGTKQALDYARDHSVEDSLRQMGWLQSGIWSNRHVGEAVRARQEKRAAEFPPLAPLHSFAAPR